MYSLKKFLFQKPWHYLFALLLTAVIALLRFFTLPEETALWFALYDSISIAGYVTFLIGGLIAVTQFGAFDMFAYALSPSNYFSEKRKFRNYTEYHEHQQEKRSREGAVYMPYLVVGCAVFLLSLFIA